MPKVIYKQTLSRTIEVEVSDEQLATLKDHNIPGDDTTGRYAKLNEAIDFVVSTACAHQDEYPLEFSMGYCVDENDEELFDL